MKGLELSRAYYEQEGRPMLEREFPFLVPRIAAGRVGEGSECLGFDDEISRDHDFVPGFCLWLLPEDFARYGAELAAAYERLPREFLGFSRDGQTARGVGRTGVFSVPDFYARFIGREQPPKDLYRWLRLPESSLALLAAGEVYTDPAGEFSAIREVIRGYYPEDVRRKKIAARIAVMAQSGQYNYFRCRKRNDPVAAIQALSAFVQSTLSLVYLCSRIYMPYYKWAWHGLSVRTDIALAPVLPLLRILSEHPWEPEPIEEICRLAASELRREGLSDVRDDFLEAHVDSVMQTISDPVIARCGIMEG